MSYLDIFCFVSQELHYNYFEMRNTMDLSGDESPDFQNALSVHPVSNPEQMYRLHRYFTERELQKTYEEIKKLQVKVSSYFFFFLCLSVPLYQAPSFTPYSTLSIAIILSCLLPFSWSILSGLLFLCDTNTLFPSMFTIHTPWSCGCLIISSSQTGKVRIGVKFMHLFGRGGYVVIRVVRLD